MLRSRILLLTIYPFGLVRFFASETKRPDQTNFRAGNVYLGLSRSEISVHRWPAPLLWFQGEVGHHGRRAWRRKAAQDMVIRKQRGLHCQGQNVYPKVRPPGSHSLWPHPTRLQCHPAHPYHWTNAPIRSGLSQPHPSTSSLSCSVSQMSLWGHLISKPLHLLTTMTQDR